MKSFQPGEVRINGVNVFINDKNVASLKSMPPPTVVRNTAPPGHKHLLNVPYIKQDAHDHCGRASGAMVKRYYHSDAKIGKTYRDGKKRVHLELAALTPGGISASTGKNYQYATVHDLSEVERSLQEGNPVIVYTNVYKRADSNGNHIFVLTGYDPTVNSKDGGQFYANNTLGHGPEGGDPVGVTEINHIPLTANSLTKHLYQEFYGHNVLYVKPK